MRLYDKEIGDQVRAVRLKLGWTQTQLATRLGVSTSAVCRYEKGKGISAVQYLKIVELKSRRKK